MSVTGNNPNATLAGGTTGVAAAVTYLLSLTTWNVPPTVAVLAAGGVTTLLLFIGRNGIRGLFKMIWRGQGGAA